MTRFDVFLSHNSQDKPAVRELARLLEGRGLGVWLDEDQLVPGRNWQPLLEQGIERSAAGAVLVGKDGIGPWESEEMQTPESKGERPVSETRFYTGRGQAEFKAGDALPTVDPAALRAP